MAAVTRSPISANGPHPSHATPAPMAADHQRQKTRTAQVAASRMIVSLNGS